jgi:hypothetical protein
MAQLDPDQVSFLKSQGIMPWSVFDASGMTQPQYRAAMKELGLPIAYGVTPCAAMGHTLRTRAGHCVQCNTARIAFMRRNDDAAYVYVARSASTGLVKIGVTGDVDARLASLRKLGYGGAADWQLVSSTWRDRAGAVEFDLHATLAKFHVRRTYVRDGLDVECRELFLCPAEIAVAALEAKRAA